MEMTPTCGLSWGSWDLPLYVVTSSLVALAHASCAFALTLVRGCVLLRVPR